MTWKEFKAVVDGLLEEQSISEDTFIAYIDTDAIEVSVSLSTSNGQLQID